VSLNLKPVECFAMLKEEYAEFRQSPAFVRKAINCCAQSNALPEIIFAEYGLTRPQKIHRAKSALDYREHLRRDCEAHHTVRDICDFCKHGPRLGQAGSLIRYRKGHQPHEASGRSWPALARA
jgi:hypothetical protein